jgi:hypothetical protein
MQIEQAIYGSKESGGYRFLARSPGFRDDWLPTAEQLCMGFGERPAGAVCPSCVFARPFDRRHVAVVQAADQGTDDSGRPGALGFHLLILPRSLYVELGGDPFFIAEQYPPPWQARSELPSLTWSTGAPPTRTVAMLQKTLNVPYSATLLGGVQILLDGGRLVFERSGPDPAILRSLWALLPTSERSRRWPASFAFGNAHRFDAVVVPRAFGPDFEHYVTEEKAGDYPEGRFECNLQSAIETGDQNEIDALLNHNRSRSVRIALVLLAMVIFLSLAAAFLLPTPPPVRPVPTNAKASPPALDLPAPEECRSLDLHERTQFAARLHVLGAKLRIALPEGISDDTLAADLAVLDRRLGTPDARRDAGPLRNFGPIQRQLRVLLWKHAIADYSDRRLNMMELLERLEQRLVNEGKLTEEAGDR